MKKGYFVGTEFNDHPLLCFRDCEEPSNLIFGIYPNWHPRICLTTDKEGADWLEKTLTDKIETKDYRIDLADKPKNVGKCIMPEDYSVEFRPLYAVELKLLHFKDKNILRETMWKFIKSQKVYCPFYGTYPAEKLSYEELFCFENNLVPQNAYELELEEQNRAELNSALNELGRKTNKANQRKIKKLIGSLEDVLYSPDKKHEICNLLGFKHVQERNKKIGICAMDEESSLKNIGDIRVKQSISIALSTPKKDILIGYKTPGYQGSAEEFFNKYIAENEKHRNWINESGLKNQVIMTESRKQMFEVLALELKDAANYCDIFVGYNNKGYDNKQFYRQLKEFKIDLYGKGGYSISQHPDQTGVSWRSGFVSNLDLLRDANKARLFLGGLVLSRKKLEDIEHILGIYREEKFGGKHAAEALANPIDLPGIYIHNVTDARATRLITEKEIGGCYETI